MNYAEDRLDRRARSSENTDSTEDQLSSDLKRAHDVFAVCIATFIAGDSLQQQLLMS